MVMAQRRNVATKGGRKPAPVDQKKRKADEVRVREQWERAWDEFERRDAEVQKRNLFKGPEVTNRDTAARHLLAVSKSLSEIIGLAEEDEGKMADVLKLTKGGKDEGGGKGEVVGGEADDGGKNAEG